MMNNTIRVVAEFTEDDFKGDPWNPRDCPGYRAIKRVVPNLDRWYFFTGWTSDDTFVKIPPEAGHKLHLHALYKRDGPSSMGKQGEPFTCAVTIGSLP